ncbi:MAG: hypothetical protein LBT62_00500 [Deltaproteobacteria bacterium]|nr:hypothetical protein [Deltaproteobacteria bacterium]
MTADDNNINKNGDDKDGKDLDSQADDELHVDADENFFQKDIVLEFPETDQDAPPQPQPPKSQAIQDLESLDPSELVSVETEDKKPDKAQKKGKKMSDKPMLANSHRGYQWFFVHLFGLLGLVAWAAGSFLSDLPYRWEAVGIALAVLLLTIPTMKRFHVRTRAGLAGLGAALGLALCALYQPNAQFLPGIPLSIVWVFILTLTWIWLIVAILRNQDFRKNRVSLVLCALLLYPMFAPIVTIFKTLVFAGADVSTFSMDVLNESPLFITSVVPWFFWPQAVLAFLIPPLASIFLLKDQLAAYKTSEPDSKHLGGLWLSLAGFIVLIFSFLTFQPAYSEYPAATAALKNLLPSAAEYQARLEENQRAALLAQAPKNVPEPASSSADSASPQAASQEESSSPQAGEPTSQAPTSDQISDDGAALNEAILASNEQSQPAQPLTDSQAESQADSSDAIDQDAQISPEALTELGETNSSPTQAPDQTAQETYQAPQDNLPTADQSADQAALIDQAALTDAGSTDAGSADAGSSDAAALPRQTPTEVGAEPTDSTNESNLPDASINSSASTPLASSTPSTTITSEALATTLHPDNSAAPIQIPDNSAAHASEITIGESDSSVVPSPLSVTVTSLEVGHSENQPSPQTVPTFIVHEDSSRPSAPLAAAVCTDSSQEMAATMQELNEYKTRVSVLEAQNELLKERLKISDQLVLNLTSSNR